MLETQIIKDKLKHLRNRPTYAETSEIYIMMKNMGYRDIPKYNLYLNLELYIASVENIIRFQPNNSCSKSQEETENYNYKFDEATVLQEYKHTSYLKTEQIDIYNDLQIEEISNSDSESDSKINEEGYEFYEEDEEDFSD